MMGRIVILNGTPRAGKSSIAAAILERLDGDWINLGVDAWMKTAPAHLLPGIGLRPGGERPDLEDFVVQSYAALFDAIAVQCRAGKNIASDLGLHERYSRPLGILEDCARRLGGLPVLFVGVRCPVEIVMQRRNAGEGRYVKGTADDPVPEPVRRWQDAVHAHGVYDLELDTSLMTAEQCADAIGRILLEGCPTPSAFERLAVR